MKKKIIIVSILIILVIVLLLIPRDVYRKIFKKGNPNPDGPAQTQVYQTLFVKNSNNVLVGVNVLVNSIEEDTVSQKWDLLTTNAASIPTNYTSPINQKAKLLGHEENNGVLTLNVSSEFLESAGRSAIECLAWNYCNNSISEVVVKVNDEVINMVDGYYFSKISKDLGANLTFETNYLFEADHVTIVYHDNGLITPVTYFYDSSYKKMDYIVAKMFSSNTEMSDLVSSKAYSYELKNNIMVINIDYSKELTEDVIATITDTIKQNYIIDSLTLNGTASVLLQETFYKIENQ